MKTQTCKQCGGSFERKSAQPFCSRRCQGDSKRLEPVASFWSRVAVGAPDECWLWTGEVNNNGYARFAVTHAPERVRVLGHRYSYELANGEIPAGKVILHSCDNPPCVNPNHLRVGTQLDNMRDAHAKGRMNLSGLEIGWRMNEQRRGAA